MRIAICFSGEIRTGVEASPNLLNFIGDLLPYTDFFIHTWDHETKKNYNGVRIKGRVNNFLDHKFKGMLEIYNPKKMIVENFNDVYLRNKSEQSETLVFHYLPPFWYSFMESVSYKRNYEIENGFEYDYVVKLRPDIIFNTNRNLMKEIEMCVGDNEKKFYIENFTEKERTIYTIPDDVYFFSKSKTMDLASKYHIVSQEKINNFGYSYKYSFYRHLFENDIICSETDEIFKYYESIYMYTIYREECLNISPITDFRKCFDCNNYYFDVINNYDKNKNLYINDLKKKFIIDHDVENVLIGEFKYVDELKPKSII